jgi:hypothetical protein
VRPKSQENSENPEKWKLKMGTITPIPPDKDKIRSVRQAYGGANLPKTLHDPSNQSNAATPMTFSSLLSTCLP